MFFFSLGSCWLFCGLEVLERKGRSPGLDPQERALHSNIMKDFLVSSTGEAEINKMKRTPVL